MAKTIIMAFFSAGALWVSAAVPDKFLEYIDSAKLANGSWIDAGVKATTKTALEIDFQLLEAWAQSTPFGVGGGSFYFDLYLDGSLNWAYWYCHGGWSKGKYTTVAGDATSRLVVKLDGANKLFTLTNLTTGVSVSNAMNGEGVGVEAGDVTDVTLPIFGRKTTSDSVSSTAKMRCWGCKIWEDGVLVRDFRPALVGSVAGMWDVVGEQFYSSGNATWPFIAGPKIKQGLAVILR